ncbi:MAG: creatininase family protein [Deltaproteobacteria bacterium]|nr:creatininase family protein [Candidatus Zymogenaceae bacterium]
MIIENISTVAFEEGLKKTRTVIIPLGAVEEHGPHLPMNTDILHAYVIAKKTSENIDVFVAPPIYFGVCRSTARFPGTIDIRPETLEMLIIDVVSSLYRHGLRRFILYSGHAGMNHRASMLNSSDALLEMFDDIVVSSITDADLVDREFVELVETAGDSHAGEIETSLMMSIVPELVGDPPKADAPVFPRSMVVKDTRTYWKSGVWGNPQKATADKGRRMMEILAKNLETLVTRVGSFSE